MKKNIFLNFLPVISSVVPRSCHPAITIPVVRRIVIGGTQRRWRSVVGSRMRQAIPISVASIAVAP